MSTTGALEIELLGYVGAGTISAEAHEPGEPPSRIFDIHDNVEVAVDWSIPASLNRCICGFWECDLYLESMGEGREFEIEGPSTPVTPANNVYHAVIPIPHDTIVPATGETDIPYKLTVSVTYKNALKQPGPIAGFVELPMTQFYKDV